MKYIMNTIVAIPVKYTNARRVCNNIQEESFEDYAKLRKFLNEKLKIEDDEQPQFFSLDAFMEECNDQLFNYEGTFISYCNVINLINRMKYVVYLDGHFFDNHGVKEVIQDFFNEDRGYTAESITKVKGLGVNELVEIEEGHIVVRVR